MFRPWVLKRAEELRRGDRVENYGKVVAIEHREEIVSVLFRFESIWLGFFRDEQVRVK